MKFIAGISSTAALICLLSWTGPDSASAFVPSSTTSVAVAPPPSSSSLVVGSSSSRWWRGQQRCGGGTSFSSLNAEAIKITMPALSSTMKEGRVVTWLKAEGDEIEAGEAIMVVESDKADMDVEAFEDGFLAKILTREGETAEVGAVVALVAALQGDIASVAEGGGGATTRPRPLPRPTGPPRRSWRMLVPPLQEVSCCFVSRDMHMEISGMWGGGGGEGAFGLNGTPPLPYFGLLRSLIRMLVYGKGFDLDTF